MTFGLDVIYYNSISSQTLRLPENCIHLQITGTDKYKFVKSLGNLHYFLNYGNLEDTSIWEIWIALQTDLALLYMVLIPQITLLNDNTAALVLVAVLQYYVLWSRAIASRVLNTVKICKSFCQNYLVTENSWSLRDRFHYTVKPVLRDHCHKRPPVLKNHLL